MRKRALEFFPSISATATPARPTLAPLHKKHHAPEFHFDWATDHFIGYFIDGDGRKAKRLSRCTRRPWR
jgi:hypothetical protein